MLSFDYFYLVLVMLTFFNTYAYIEVYIYINLGLHFFWEKDLIFFLSLDTCLLFFRCVFLYFVLLHVCTCIFCFSYVNICLELYEIVVWFQHFYLLYTLQCDFDIFLMFYIWQYAYGTKFTFLIVFYYFARLK